MIGPGSSCVIAHDIVIGGSVAFLAAEHVTVEKIVSNAQRPEYKFVVLSTALNQRFQLRLEDFVAASKATETNQPEKTAPSDSGGVWSTVRGLFILATLITALILGFVWGSWWGILIGFAVWIFCAGWIKLGFDVSSAGDAARKQLKKDE